MASHLEEESPLELCRLLLGILESRDTYILFTSNVANFTRCVQRKLNYKLTQCESNNSIM